MFKVAVVGSIGSGKSIATAIFETQGFYAINLDKLAKHILNTNISLVEEITAEFGTESYAGGHYNSSHIAAEVLKEPERLKRLNEVTFPYIKSALADTMMEAERKGAELLVVEGAVLIEMGIAKMFDYIVEVDSDEYIRLKRIMERNSYSYEEAKKRIEIQNATLTSFRVEGIPSCRIQNTGSLENFIIRVGAVAHDIKEGK